MEDRWATYQHVLLVFGIRGEPLPDDPLAHPAAGQLHSPRFMNNKQKAGTHASIGPNPFVSVGFGPNSASTTLDPITALKYGTAAIVTVAGAISYNMLICP
jgi:hypothetical protein